MAEADYEQRVAATRERMEEAGLDALLVASQYNRRYLTGFSHADGDITESSGWALVTRDALNLITGTFYLTSLEHEIVPSGAEVLSTDVAPAHKVLAAALERAGVHRLGFEKVWLSYGRYERIRAAVAETMALVPGADIVERVRMTKDDAEVAVMRRAAQIADQAFARLVAEIHPGMTERQIAAR
ncbi:MAG: aminopeptidase P family N-terminal domain-containing protein, partial [Ktedonobacterales bacterium]